MLVPATAAAGLLLQTLNPPSAPEDSTQYLVWTRSRFSFSTDPACRAAEELQHLCQGPSGNVFGITVNYWTSD